MASAGVAPEEEEELQPPLSAFDREMARRHGKSPSRGLWRGQAPPPETLRSLGVTAEQYAAARQAHYDSAARMVAVLQDPAASGEDKHDAQARHYFEHGRNVFACPDCWLLRGEGKKFACICGRIRRFRLAEHLEVLIHMHTYEYGRGSSTGGLLAISLDPCRILVRGLKEHERELRARAEDPDTLVAVLWPDRDGASLLPAEVECLRGGRKLALVAIDGTWNTARKVVARLPKDWVRMRVEAPWSLVAAPAPGDEADALAAFEGESLLAPARRYRGGGDCQNAGRTSTLEAVVAALEGLGEPQATIDGLLDNLKLKVDSVLHQTGRGRVYYPEDDAQRALAKRFAKKLPIANQPIRYGGANVVK